MKQLIGSLIVTVLSSVSVANAAFVDTFAGGAPQQAWNFASLPGGSTFTSTYSANNGGYLQLASNTAVGGGGAVAAFGFVAQNFGAQGVVVRANLNPNAATLARDIGILANLNTAQLTGYALTVDFTAGQLDMSKINPGGATAALGSTVNILNFSAAGSYDVELEVAGGNVIGRLYGSTNNLLHTISVADASYTSGFAGVVASRNTDDAVLSGTFGSVTAAVPEPGGISLLMGMAIALTSVRRRQRV